MESQRDFELTHKGGAIDAGEGSSFENESEGELSLQASLSTPFPPSRRLLIKPAN